MVEVKKRWLESFTWDVIVEMNRRACEAGGVLHQPSKDGYEKGKTLWEESIKKELTFREVVEICRLCHRMGPFAYFNGSLFTGIARSLSDDFVRDISQTRAFMFRSAIGHYVAGVIGTQALEDIFKRLMTAPEENR